MWRYILSAQLLSSTTYDRLKRFTQIGFPAAGTLYFTIAQIWGLPYGEQVVGTLAAITLFCGIALGVSKKQYDSSGAGTSGTILIDTSDPEKDVYRLELIDPVESLRDKNSVTFTVDASHDLQGL